MQMWISSMIVLALMVFFHEFGHYMKLRQYGCNTKLRFNGFDLIFDVPDHLSDVEKVNVFSAGILLGLYPLCLGLIPYPNAAILLIVYLCGCFHDANMIRKIRIGDI